MADEAKKIITRQSIQSKIQESNLARQKQVASSTAAAQGGSTTTPIVTDTPKVTPTAKAMPTREVTPVSSATINQPTQSVSRPDITDLLTPRTTTIKKAETPDLLSSARERLNITPLSLNLVKAADTQGGTVKETVDKTLFQQFSDFFNNKPKEINKKASDLFVSKIDEEGIHLSKRLENFFMQGTQFINNTEYAILKTIDVASKELGYDTGFTKDLGRQFSYWEKYGEKRGEESLAKYEEDVKAQGLRDKIYWEIIKATDDKDWAEGISNAIGRAYSAATDPEEFFATLGYMVPGLIATMAGGGGFWLSTSVFAPAYSTEAYQDYSKDEDITNNWGDTGVWGASSASGILQAMFEEAGDAWGNMPWAKGFRKEVRNFFTKMLKKDIVKGGEKAFLKEIEEIADKNIVKRLRNSFVDLLKDWHRGAIGEGIEEVVQDTIQTEIGIAMGSEREHMSVEEALTDYFLGKWFGLEMGGIGTMVNYKQNQDLKKEYNKFSDNLDKLAPGINEETKQTFFAAMVASQEQDANLSEKKIEKYESQVTQLYNQISQLEQQAEATTNENAKTQINNQIDGLNNQIKEIDKKINQWNNTKQEIDEYLQEYTQKKEEEELSQQNEIQLSKEEGGENLSEQTMRDTGTEISVEEPKYSLEGVKSYQTNTPEFKNWFKDSQVVDKEGNPLVVYHGTRRNITVPNMKKGKEFAYGGGMYFTTSKEGAEHYSESKKGLLDFLRNPRVMEVYLSIQNPIKQGVYKWDNRRIEELKNLGYKVNEEYLSREDVSVFDKYFNLVMMQDYKKLPKLMEDFSRITGYDGLMVEQPNGEQYWIAFRPEQIKSATDNIGTFNVNDSNIKRDVEGEVSVGEWDIEESKKSFEMSMEQIKNGTKYYDTQFARNYAYATSGKYIVGDTKQNQQMINKVQKLLNGIGIKLRLTNNLEKGTRGLYSQGIAYYKKGNKELTLYGHEVFHAMMDVINNGELDNAKLQAELQDILRDAIGEVKKQFGIDGYKSGEELKYANTFAEEWLANSFGEYLAGREIAGPKTFIQRIIDFFNQILDLFNGNKGKDLNSKLKYAFDKIANGEVTGKRGIPKVTQMYSASPIESSTEITQEELRNTEGYAESQEEDSLQTKQQNELGEHGEEIMEAGKESDFENEIYNDSMNVEVSEDVLSGKASITPQVVIDAFGKNKKKRFKALSIMKTEVLQGAKDILTPAKTRIFNISPRIGGRLIQMETQSGIYTHRYRERAKPFVEAISKLDDKAKLEIKKALLDYGALASEQGENIEQYKQEEVAKLKEVLNKYGISEDATNDMFAMLNELGQRYKDAGLSITLSDIYFPRTVTDYEGLQNYIAEQTGIPQEEKSTLLKRIQDITIDNKLTEEEKEKKIRHWMTTDYHEPGKKSKNAKERKMGLLSEWGEGIYQFYGDPIEALDNYIVTMEDAIQKQLFLGGLQEEAGLKGENVSLEEILMGLVREGKISNEDLKELKESVSSVLNKKPTPKIVKTAKSIVHIGLLANFISAITQFDDLGVVILKDRKGLINICKTLFGKAGIQYTELGLENSYEMFKDQLNITNWFFAKSLFNWVDRIGKTSFINTAWDSLKRQAKKTKDGKDTRARANLVKRLTDMYGEDTANHIMEKIDSDNYMTNGQVDIDVLTDLLYLLSESQPLYTSDMPTAYLNNGWVRLCYSLQSFTIKRINMLIQGTKQVYENNGGGAAAAVKAGTWLMYTTFFLAMRGAMIGDAQDFLKGDEDETALYKLITEGIDKALEQLWKDSKGSWLKIWNLSDYDKKIYNRQGAWGWLMSKFEPPIIGMGADLLEAITEHNKDEITDLAKYTPIIGKLLYYWFWDELSDSEFELDLGDDFELDLGDFELDLDEDFELNI